MTSQHPVEDIYALTPLQQGMLLHTLCATVPGLYVVQSCWTLGGELDVPRFRAAWQRTVVRHPALRTAFEWRDLEQPVQVVYRTVELPIVPLDWRSFGPADHDRGLEHLLDEDRTRGFDLSQPPLHRVTLVRLAGERWHLLWTYHQAVLDGWSCALVQSEVATVYQALVDSEEPALAEPALYRDYLAWLERQDPGRAERFWRTRLAGFTAPTILEPRRSQEGKPSLAAGRREEIVSCDAQLTAELAAALRGARITLSTLVQAAWAVVLGRRSGAGDVLFGSVVSGRPPGLAGVDSMVGFFINTVPTRIRVRENVSLRCWLRELQADFLAVRELEHCSLVDIQSFSDVPRGQALFETVLAFENYPVENPEQGWGGATEVLDFGARENLNYALALFSGVIEGRLTFKALYDAAHYDGATVRWVLEELRTFAAQARDGLDRPVGALEVVPEAERRQLVVDWNRTAVAVPSDRPFSRLFEVQVARSPDRRAVVCGTEALTYAELAARVEAVARRLVERGVRRGSVVGILADRDVDFLAVMLAAFRIGAAYLPLDPRAPAARQAQTWGQAELALVVFSPGYAEVSAEAAAGMEGDGPRLVALAEVARGGGASAPGTGPGTGEAEHSPNDLAYVIFTSGSTGLPKGAMVEQRGMINHLCAKIADLELGPDDRIAQNASQCFDISVWQFLAALLVGGETHIFPDEVAYDPRALLEAVEREGVTILETVPSLLRLLLDSDRRDAPPRLAALRWMIPTGEALPPEVARWWLERFPHVPMLNAYGPTECSDDVTHHPIRVAPQPTATRVPIGRPIANTTIFILDSRLRLTPTGVAGELYVGGAGVGRGYVNDPAKTASTFVPDPFADRPGARLYRTGDLARFLEDGTIDFLGRLDHQVKIRGFRIELGDIEAALAQCPGIDSCAVTARAEGGGDARLVAYLTCPGEAPAVAELRDHLAARLPDYMVPQAFVRLDAMPLSPNGKLDRKALPAPAAGRPDSEAELEPPSNEVEERVAEVWQQVLGVTEVGRRDNFFDLGGHSLLLMKVFERLSTHHPRLALVDLFHFPTVDALARYLESGEEATRSHAERQQPQDRREARRRQRERRNRARAGEV